MFIEQRVSSFDDPALLPYRSLRQQEFHRSQNIFVAEGEKVVRRLLESSLEVISVLLPEKWLNPMKPLLASRSENFIVYTAPKSVLENLTGFSLYQGILACARVPPPADMEEILSRPGPLLVAAVEGLSNAENMGVVVRNCAAFGVDLFVAGENSGSPYLRRAVRSSMGTVFKLPVFESPNLSDTLLLLRSQGVFCLAAHPHEEKKTLTQFDLRKPTCLVFGSEGQGLSPKILKVCSDAAAVPMAPGVDSLNVGSAAAVFLYEAWRQRSLIGGSY